MAETFEYRGATLTVRPPTVGARTNAEVIEAVLIRLRPNVRHWGIMQFAQFCASTTVTEGELPFSIPAMSDSDEAIAAAYDDWFDSDASLIDDWRKAYDTVTHPKDDSAAAKTS